MQSISRNCQKCKKYQTLNFLNQDVLDCPECHEKWGEVKEKESIFKSCPVCECKQFYLSKDFNQVVGCSIMLIGIVLVPWTYGLSLPVFALIDWFLHKKVKVVVNCYRCGCEFRGFTYPEKLKSFMHHIGLKYDKYR